MGEIGTSVNVPSWPVTLDTNSTVEVDTVPGMSIGTIVKAATINDVSAIALRLEAALSGKWIDAAYYDSIVEADAVAVAAGKTLMISTAITLPSGPITLSATLEFKRSGSIAKSSATSLSIAHITGNPMHQIFSGFAAGEVIINAGSIGTVFPQWWYSGSGAYTTASQSAINSLSQSGGTVFFKDATYSIGKLTCNYSGLRIKGQSVTHTIIVIENGTTTDYAFDIDLSGSVRPFSFIAENFTLKGPSTAIRTYNGFYLNHVYQGGISNVFFKALNNLIKFSDSYWSIYENIWAEHYTTGFSGLSAAYAGNHNTFNAINFFDGNVNGTAIPVDTTYMGNCKWDGCSFGSSADYKMGQIKFLGTENLIQNCRFESIRSDSNSVIVIGSKNTFINNTIGHQYGFGINTTDKFYIQVSGNENLLLGLPTNFYGNILTLDYGTQGNKINFNASNGEAYHYFRDYGANSISFGIIDNLSKINETAYFYTKSNSAVTNLFTRSVDFATITLDGLTKTTETATDINGKGPFNTGGVYKFHTPTVNRRWRFSLGSIAANECYAFLIFMKAVSGTEIISIGLDPQETPRDYLIRSDIWQPIWKMRAMQGGPFTRYIDITLPVSSNGIYMCAPCVTYLGAIIAGIYPSFSGLVYVPTSNSSKTDISDYPNTIYAAAIPTAGIWSQGRVIWNLDSAAGVTPGWVCVTSGEPGTWKAMANLAA